MSKYLYTLIVSQYRYSRHCFIVKHQSNFTANAVQFIEDLENHKRGIQKEKHPIHLGDFMPEYIDDNPTRQRYNVNDRSGDIYFLQSPTATYCMEMARVQFEDERSASKGYQRVKTVEDVRKHHDYTDILKIVERYFEIA